MKIIFLGTPEFAVESLKAILQSRHEVVAVVTAPDAMGGRGRKELIQSEVKKFAVSHSLKILQPEKLRDPEFLRTLASLKADIQVVVAFRMLPEKVWNMPPLGTINVHGSLLPKYRGAAPIHWAVINGETETGVTIFKLKHEIDTGDIISQAKLPIDINDTTGDVYTKLMKLGADTLVKALDALETNSVTYIKQEDDKISPAPKLFHEICELDLNDSNLVIHNKVRGLNPKPSAWLSIDNTKYFIHKTILSTLEAPQNATTLFKKDNLLYLKTKQGCLQILEVQPEGKRRMTGEEFARGLR